PISDDESGVVSHLVNQITNPVRWDKVTSRLADTEAIIELPPAGTLTRLVRRALSAQVLPINSPDDIPAGQALLAACMSYAS
ncbi:MAG: hypothetical protein LBB58_06255, partial [Cellulomonadaceae bacterium]|nr:hypothetical protein [Cellulomonadaceae bacterium]